MDLIDLKFLARYLVSRSSRASRTVRHARRDHDHASLNLLIRRHFVVVSRFISPMHGRISIVLRYAKQREYF